MNPYRLFFKSVKNQVVFDHQKTISQTDQILFFWNSSKEGVV